MAGSALAEEKGDDFKKEVLIVLHENTNLKKINGEAFSAEDMQEAMALKEERRREALNLPPPKEEGEEDAEEDAE
jgi:hypothetical protein